MDSLNLGPIFMTGMLGGVHCIGMCGGIVSAMSTASSATSSSRRQIPILAAGAASSAIPVKLTGDIAVAISYNAGRIGSYMTAGAIAGGIAGSVRMLPALSVLQSGAYWLANFMLILLGLYLMNAWRGLSYLEQIGKPVWRRVQPWTKQLLPVDSLPKAVLLGALWGWLPCGMVYSVLLTAMLTGTALGGATVMLAFGLGTLPLLLSVGLIGTRIQNQIRKPWVRIASGSVVLLFGVLGWIRAAHGLSFGWMDALCLTPSSGMPLWGSH